MPKPNLAVVAEPRTPDEKFAVYLAGLDDDLLACKASKHNIPKLKPARLPEGIEVRRKAGGIYEVTVHCLDCGLPCTAVTEKGGVLGADVRWKYDYTLLPGFRAPKGTGRERKAEYKAELGSRAAPAIREAAARSASEAAAEKRKAAAAMAARTPKKARGGNQHATSPWHRRSQREGERKLQQGRERQAPPATFLPGAGA